MEKENKVNIKVSIKLRDNLMSKKYKLKFDGLNTTIQKMYDAISKFKLWGELKEIKKNGK